MRTHFIANDSKGEGVVFNSVKRVHVIGKGWCERGDLVQGFDGSEVRAKSSACMHERVCVCVPACCLPAFLSACRSVTSSELLRYHAHHACCHDESRINL